MGEWFECTNSVYHTKRDLDPWDCVSGWVSGLNIPTAYITLRGILILGLSQGGAGG